ncbi:hypothetical protein NC653_008357 [Populus alba x Populus x berolinensis]|uniref:Uncharacterized protein n=1 Tax=Populus alba x Populus x berolinensis TaxID=444605 RepID=A0AAD6R6J8_9ROSI|nr:hypothetical protein NC653_008357 [Populus alba x Populus x berolinensis]
MKVIPWRRLAFVVSNIIWMQREVLMAAEQEEFPTQEDSASMESEASLRKQKVTRSETKWEKDFGYLSLGEITRLVQINFQSTRTEERFLKSCEVRKSFLDNSD